MAADSQRDRKVKKCMWKREECVVESRVDVCLERVEQSCYGWKKDKFSAKILEREMLKTSLPSKMLLVCQNELCKMLKELTEWDGYCGLHCGNEVGLECE